MDCIEEKRERLSDKKMDSIEEKRERLSDILKNIAETARQRLNRRVDLFHCEYLDSGSPDVLKRMQTDEELCCDARVLRIHDWPSNAIAFFELWVDHRKKMKRLDIVQRCMEIWTEELQRGRDALRKGDKPRQVFNMMIHPSVHTLTKVVYGWSTDTHTERMLRFVNGAIKEKMTDVICAQCFQSVIGSELKKCHVCHGRVACCDQECFDTHLRWCAETQKARDEILR